MPATSSYSRLGYFALIVEATENVAVKPTHFVPVTKAEVVAKYDVSIAMPIEANPVLNIDGVPNAIAAPSGKVSLLIEPKTFGHFLKGLYGTVTDGVYLPVSGVSGTFQVGETVTGGSSGKTATVAAISAEGDYLLVSSPSGNFTAGETITGGTSSATATAGTSDTTVYGHEFTMPTVALPTYTVEIGFQNQALRYTGVRFNDIMVNQKNNIIGAEITMTARSEFKHARITAVTANGSGTKVLTVDQTTGLVVGDVCKIYRPSTDTYLDFNGSSVKTNTVTAIGSETSVSFTNLTTSVAVGDLLVLAPQTPSYTVANELTWIGASTLRLSETSMTAALTATPENVEDFEVSLTREIESRHAANGSNLINRFPQKNYEKGLKGAGKIKKVYTSDTFLERVRNNIPFSVDVVHTGDVIGSTSIRYSLEWRAPKVILNAFAPTLQEDALLDQDMPYTLFNSLASGYFHKAILVNNIASY